LVSHDRHLLKSTADELWLVAEGHAQPFDGDLDDYARWLATQRTRESEPSKPAPVPVAQVSVKNERRTDPQTQTQQRTLQKEVDKLEKQIAAWQSECVLLETRLADPGLYAPGSDAVLAQTLQKRRGELSSSIEQAEARWLEAQETLEGLT